jgi:hypothetical protein
MGIGENVKSILFHIFIPTSKGLFLITKPVLKKQSFRG